MTSVSRTCSVEGCPAVQVRKTWCREHYDYWVENKQPDDYLQKPVNGDRVCTVWWCDRIRKGRGLCSMHLTRESKGRDMDIRPKFRNRTGLCCIPGCGGKVLAKAYCPTHYSRLRRGLDVFAPMPPKTKTELCTIPGCGRAARSWNLCHTHYARKLRGKDMYAPVQERVSQRHCSVRGCEERHQSRGGCSQHYRQMRIYKVSYEWIALKEELGCAICGEKTRLQIDHDHSCCPSNQEVCGKCNRGMLCFPCNAGIGQFRDDIETMEKAIQYLREGQNRDNQGEKSSE